MILDICGQQSRIWRFLTDTEHSRHGRAVFSSGRTALSSFSKVSKATFSSGRAVRSFRVSFAFRFVTTLWCVSKAIFFSGRTAPSSCLRTNSVGQVASLYSDFPFENLLRFFCSDNPIVFLSFYSFFCLLMLVSITSKLCHMTLQSNMCSNLLPGQVIVQDPENVSQYTIQT